MMNIMNNNNNSCVQNFANDDSERDIKNNCYEEIWSNNSVGYNINTNFPVIEVYAYKSYNNNLTNTDPQNIPWEFGINHSNLES